MSSKNIILPQNQQDKFNNYHINLNIHPNIFPPADSYKLQTKNIDLHTFKEKDSLISLHSATKQH